MLQDRHGLSASEAGQRLRGGTLPFPPSVCEDLRHECLQRQVQLDASCRRASRRARLVPAPGPAQRSKAVVITHSEGTAESPLTRERLEKAGFPDAVGKLVAISGIMKGMPEGEIGMNKVLLTGFEAVDAGKHLDKLLDSLSNLTGGNLPTDGRVPAECSRYGREFVMLQKPYDHAGIFEDPAVVDTIARKLQTP